MCTLQLESALSHLRCLVILIVFGKHIRSVDFWSMDALHGRYLSVYFCVVSDCPICGIFYFFSLLL